MLLLSAILKLVILKKYDDKMIRGIVMRKRLITGLILLIIVTPITVINNPVMLSLFQIMVLGFVVVGTFELLSMFEKEKKIPTSIKIVTLILTITMFLNIGFQGELRLTHSDQSLITLDVNNIAIIALSTTILLSLLVFIRDFKVEDMGKVLIIVNYVGIGAASIVLLRFLGVRFIVYVAIIGVFTDSFAYFIGIIFGKHRMVPHISPKKTWEGAIGGALFATFFGSLFAIFYGMVFPTTGWLGNVFNPNNYQTIFDNFSSIGDQPIPIQALIIVPITFFGSIVSQLGDLVASKMKRSYGIKDFSNLLPGHGGVLDRFDSVLLTSMFLVSVFLLIAEAFPLIGG